MQQVRAKKRLGQHFLRDEAIALDIAKTPVFAPTDVCNTGKMQIIEVGPGTGVLTKYLLQDERFELKAVELDKEAAQYLTVNYPQLNLIEGDFLKIDFNDIFSDGKFCVIGNFPYNISSQIFFKVLEYKDRIPCCSGMIQKEVAERIAAKPGNKSYGILSVMIQAYYKTEYLFTVHEHVFNPPPKVKSAVIRFVRNEVKQLPCDEALFKLVVKTAFNQRRKQMRNSLEKLIGKDNPLLSYPIFTKRPEQLNVEEFVELTKLISQCQN